MTSVIIRPETIACPSRVSDGVDELTRDASRAARYRTAGLRRIATMRARAVALGGNRVAEENLEDRFAGLVPDADERAEGPLFPRPYADPSGPLSGGATR